MRELKRSIARNMMKSSGIEQINKKKWVTKSGKMISFFSAHWKEYFDQNSKVYKQIVRSAKRKSRKRMGFSKA